MNKGLISKRYAIALYEYASERGEEDMLYPLMKELVHRLGTTPNLLRAIDSPSVRNLDKKELIYSCVADHVLPQSYKDFVDLLLTNKRTHYLSSIALGYLTVYRKVKNISIVYMASAKEMDAENLERIRVDVEQRTHGKVEFKTRVNPALKGGFIFQIDDLRLDASVKGQLDKIEREFMNKNRAIV